MALTKTAPVSQPSQPAGEAAPPVTPVGSFESMDETTAAKPAANDAPWEDPAAPAAAPAPATSTVVAIKPAGTVAVSNREEAKKFQAEVEAMKGAADFAHGNFVKFKGNNGMLLESGGGDAKLGSWVQLAMLAWDDHFEVSPGTQSPKSKDAVAYSKDGITIDSVIGKEKYGNWVGKRVDDYVEFLRTDGDYPNAAKKNFVDVAGIVLSADKNGEKFVGESIQVTLSKTSITSFRSYQENLVMKAKAAARGIPGVKVPEDPFNFYFVCEVVTANGNTWTKLNISTTQPK